MPGLLTKEQVNCNKVTCGKCQHLDRNCVRGDGQIRPRCLKFYWDQQITKKGRPMRLTECLRAEKDYIDAEQTTSALLDRLRTYS